MPDFPKRISRFWQELKRRRVIHVITVYASAAFVIIELINNLEGPLNLPPGLGTIVVVILAVGFPLAVILSWLFDLTAEGIEKTKSRDEIKGEAVARVPNAWKIATYVSFVIIVALVVFNLSVNLKQVKAGSIQAMAVLPFGNYTGDEQLEYFVSGMHSSLIGDLGKIEGLRVIGETSSNSYKNKNIPVPQIASELKVDAVIEAMVTCLEDSICAQFKLIGAFPEEQLIWSKSYRTDKRNILNLYNWVITDIAKEIQLPLSPEQQTRLDQPRAVNPDAYELYLNGKFHMGFLTRESQEAALDYFTRALEIDPEYAEAYAGIAGAWGFLKQMDYVTPDEADPVIRKNMGKALELNSSNEEILYFDGIIKVWTDFNWEAGERSLQRCLEINPNASLARAYYSHLMMLLKRPEEMKEQMTLALENDPKNPLIRVLGMVEKMMVSEYNSCISNTLNLQKSMPNNPLIMLILFQCYVETGEYDLAIAELAKVLGQIADKKVVQTLNATYQNEGFRKALVAAADLWVELPDFASAQNAIMLYSYGDHADKALYWLEKAYIRRDAANPYIGVVPYLRPYHNDPRYIEIMQRMNLPLGEFQQ